MDWQVYHAVCRVGYISVTQVCMRVCNARHRRSRPPDFGKSDRYRTVHTHAQEATAVLHTKSYSRLLQVCIRVLFISRRLSRVSRHTYRRVAASVSLPCACLSVSLSVRLSVRLPDCGHRPRCVACRIPKLDGPNTVEPPGRNTRRKVTGLV